MSDEGLEKEALCNRSDGYNDAGDYGPEALEVNQRLVALDPGNARHWNRLGRCLKEANDLERAQVAYATALKADPKSSVARNEFKGVRDRLAARQEVSAIFEDEGPEVLRSRIRAVRDIPAKTRFRLEGRLLLYSELQDISDLIGLAREHSMSGENETALRLYEEAGELGGEGVADAVNTGMAAVFRSMKEPRKAERLARRVLASNPNNSFALKALAGALGDQGRSEEAKEAYRSGWSAESRDRRRG
jgi:tetratricopeptide (TPR) repeat protein